MSLHDIILCKIIYLIVFHVGALYGLFLTLTLQVHVLSILYSLLNYFLGAIALILCNHFYAHGSFSTVVHYQWFIIYYQTRAGYNSVLSWSRNHLLHHMYNNTDSDPFNASRGLFFAHVGWFLVKEHPNVNEARKKLHVKHLINNFSITSQHDYYLYFFIMIGVVIPIGVPVYFWNERLENAFFVCFILRYVVGLHCAWLVHSVGQFYGTLPYDRHVKPKNNWFVGLLTLGEGWNNYHHSFPNAFLSEVKESTLLCRFVRFLVDKEQVIVSVKRNSLHIPSSEEIREKASRDGDGSFTE